jgi:hypothetical protein
MATPSEFGNLNNDPVLRELEEKGRQVEQERREREREQEAERERIAPGPLPSFFQT